MDPNDQNPTAPPNDQQVPTSGDQGQAGDLGQMPPSSQPTPEPSGEEGGEIAPPPPVETPSTQEPAAGEESTPDQPGQ